MGAERNTTRRRALSRNVIEQRESRMKHNRHSTTLVRLFLFSFRVSFFFTPRALDCGYLYVSVHWSCTACRRGAEWTVTNGCCRVESYCQGMKHIVVEGCTWNNSLACWHTMQSKPTESSTHMCTNTPQIYIYKKNHPPVGSPSVVTLHHGWELSGYATTLIQALPHFPHQPRVLSPSLTHFLRPERGNWKL